MCIFRVLGFADEVMMIARNIRMDLLPVSKVLRTISCGLLGFFEWIIIIYHKKLKCMRLVSKQEATDELWRLKFVLDL